MPRQYTAAGLYTEALHHVVNARWFLVALIRRGHGIPKLARQQASLKYMLILNFTSIEKIKSTGRETARLVISARAPSGNDRTRDAAVHRQQAGDYPVLRSPAAIPLIVIRMPRRVLSSCALARQRRMSST
jgi:hypothetical protein